ncbi:Protein of unknown function [Gryllus bimaculatus]|nr:Protein of unknown function [Gryllus bimaculatus]
MRASVGLAAARRTNVTGAHSVLLSFELTWNHRPFWLFANKLQQAVSEQQRRLVVGQARCTSEGVTVLHEE